MHSTCRAETEGVVHLVQGLLLELGAELERGPGRHAALADDSARGGGEELVEMGGQPVAELVAKALEDLF